MMFDAHVMTSSSLWGAGAALEYRGKWHVFSRHSYGQLIIYIFVRTTTKEKIPMHVHIVSTNGAAVESTSKESMLTHV